MDSQLRIVFQERSTTGGPTSICWYCGHRYLPGCTHFCPTAITPRDKYAIGQNNA